VHDRAVAAGFESTMAPKTLDRWPVTIAFVLDPDGYSIELLEMHEDDRTGAV
jgi:lactoylglutathione lyase